MSFLMKIGNFFVRLVLTSPLHSILSKNTLLIHYTGRKSGKRYTIPVNYTQEGEIVRITSQRDRVWWRNLNGNPEIMITMNGNQRRGRGAVLEAPEAVAAGLARYLKPAPQMARYYQIGSSTEDGFNQDDLRFAANSRVVIEVRLE